MKKSIYNIWVTKANGAFVYNSFNNVYVAVSLKLCKDFESLDLDAFAHMHPAAFQQFKEVGIIIPTSLNCNLEWDKLQFSAHEKQMSPFCFYI